MAIELHRRLSCSRMVYTWIPKSLLLCTSDGIHHEPTGTRSHRSHMHYKLQPTARFCLAWLWLAATSTKEPSHDWSSSGATPNERAMEHNQLLHATFGRPELFCKLQRGRLYHMPTLHVFGVRAPRGSPAPNALMAPRCANGTGSQLSIYHRSSEDKNYYMRRRN